MKFPVMLSLLVASTAASCIDTTQNRREMSSGRVGCPPNHVAITDETDWSWTATCGDKRYICSGGSSISCTLDETATEPDEAKQPEQGEPEGPEQGERLQRAEQMEQSTDTANK